MTEQQPPRRHRTPAPAAPGRPPRGLGVDRTAHPHEPPTVAPPVWHTLALLRRVFTTEAEPAGHYIEARWPIVLAILLAVGLYATLPDRLTFGPTWLPPAVELALLLPLLVTEPHWHPAAGWPWQRGVSTLLVGVIQLSNLLSLGLLIAGLLEGSAKTTGAQLIVEAGKIWLTNILVFGLWYWELDRGGPRARHWRTPRPPDFLFPQMSSPDLAPPGWMPTFVDYLYVAFTSATAFSPTDTLPLTPPAKLLMGVQSLISLLTLALVAARAVNILT